MNWRFWSRSDKAGENCTAIEPLLSLYSDGMASPAETRRIESHLQNCPACRQALDWMQATHLVIAARPVIPPPADLRARIARAIAEAESVKAPVLPAPVRPARRPLTLRPAVSYGFAAAVIASVAGSLFWSGHSPTQVAISKPHPFVPVVSPVRGPLPTVRPPATHPRLHPNQPHPLLASLPHSDVPKPVRHILTVHKHPAPEKLAANPSDSSRDGTDQGAAPVVTPKPPAVLAVRRPRPLKIKTPESTARMANAHVPKEHSSPAIPKPPVAPAPTHDEHVASNNGVPEHSYVPEVPKPIIHVPLIHQDKPVVHEASAIDILRGSVRHMHQASLTSHSYALKGAAEAVQDLASDSSRTLPITNGNFR